MCFFPFAASKLSCFYSGLEPVVELQSLMLRLAGRDGIKFKVHDCLLDAVRGFLEPVKDSSTSSKS